MMARVLQGGLFFVTLEFGPRRARLGLIGAE